MEEKIVARKKVTVKKKAPKKKKALKKKRVSRIKNDPKANIKNCFDAGKMERTFMVIIKTLKTLILFIERKIRKIKNKKISKRMDGDNKYNL